MCDIIVMKDGTQIETVKEFEDAFNVKSEDFRYENEWGPEIIPDSCLCQIDIEDFLTQKGFEYDGVMYIEKG